MQMYIFLPNFVQKVFNNQPAINFPKPSKNCIFPPTNRPYPTTQHNHPYYSISIHYSDFSNLNH